MKTSSKKGKWVNRIFKGASLATVALAFQACYGAPRDFGLDQYIEGVVKNTEGLPLKDIMIFMDDSIQYTKSDDEGKFYFYVHKKEEYKIHFSEEGEEKIYQSKDTTLENVKPDIYLNITLNKK